MSAVPVDRAAAAPALRLVPAMLIDAPEPTPIARVVNTLRCTNELCKLPLCEVTKARDFIPVHARPICRFKDGVATITLTCPGCGTVRVVEQR